MKKTIDVNELTVGDYISSIRSGDIFIVKRIDLENSIIEICSIEDSNEVKILKPITIKRWYRFVPKRSDTEESSNITTPPQPVEPEIEPEIKLEPPIQTAKQAVSPKVKNNCTKETPVTKLRMKLIQRCADELPGTTIKILNNYTALAVEKMNYVEIGFGRNKFTITVISKGLRPAQIKRCNVAPDSYGWTLDARYVVFSENQFEEAMDLIRSSFVYRIRNKRVSGGKKKK